MEKEKVQTVVSRQHFRYGLHDPLPIQESPCRPGQYIEAQN